MTGRDYFVFNGKSSIDFGCYVAGKSWDAGAERDVTRIEVPGRNGSLSISNGRYRNTEMTYDLYTRGDTMQCIPALRAFLSSCGGYGRLEDSISPGFFYLACYDERFGVKSSDRRGANAEIRFDMDPRKFLKDGERTRTFTASGQIFNPQLYDALPLIRAYGTGRITVNGISIQISSADTYTDIDCELQDAYKGTANCNGNITLSDGKFPCLSPGANGITLSGLSRVEIVPRWWTI